MLAIRGQRVDLLPASAGSAAGFLFSQCRMEITLPTTQTAMKAIMVHSNAGDLAIWSTAFPNLSARKPRMVKRSPRARKFTAAMRQIGYLSAPTAAITVVKGKGGGAIPAMKIATAERLPTRLLSFS